jgi:hypothetical protein
MAALVLALLLTGQAAPAANEVDPLLVQPRGWLSGPVPSEDSIVRSLNELVLTEPDRVVCVPREPTGTRRKLNHCATLQQWYDLNSDRNVPGKKAQMDHPAMRSAFVNNAQPPYELVNMITQRYRSPKAREQANMRAVTTTQPASPAQPAVSNP